MKPIFPVYSRIHLHLLGMWVYQHFMSINISPPWFTSQYLYSCTSESNSTYLCIITLTFQFLFTISCYHILFTVTYDIKVTKSFTWRVAYDLLLMKVGFVFTHQYCIIVQLPFIWMVLKYDHRNTDTIQISTISMILKRIKETLRKLK